MTRQYAKVGVNVVGISFNVKDEAVPSLLGASDSTGHF